MVKDAKQLNFLIEELKRADFRIIDLEITIADKSSKLDSDIKAILESPDEKRLLKKDDTFRKNFINLVFFHLLSLSQNEKKKKPDWLDSYSELVFS